MGTDAVADIIGRIADLQKRSEAALAVSDQGAVEPIRAIARHVATEDVQWLKALQGRRVTTALLPVPVLAVSGAGSLELPWSQYLAHMLDPHASHGLGQVLGQRLIEAFCAPNAGTYQSVSAEHFLGQACSRCGHHCTIDLVLRSERVVLAIEHKVGSGPSNWRCEDGSLHRQLEEYGKLLTASTEFRGRRVVRLYLTPNGSEPAGVGDWLAASHSSISAEFVKVLPVLIHPMQRYALCSLVLDLNSGSLGRWTELVKRLEVVIESDKELRDEPTLAARELKLLQEVAQQAGLKQLLEGMVND